MLSPAGNGPWSGRCFSLSKRTALPPQVLLAVQNWIPHYMNDKLHESWLCSGRMRRSIGGLEGKPDQCAKCAQKSTSLWKTDDHVDWTTATSAYSWP
jgi:hypothetical protein